MDVDINRQAAEKTTACSVLDRVLLICLLLANFVSKISDILLVYMYLSSGYVGWALCSLTIAVVPLGLVHLVSYRWLVRRGNASPTLKLMHLCQIGLLCRTVALYSTRCRYQQTKRGSLYTVYVYEFIDLAQLQLLLSRLQAAPQLWLQIYIVLAYNSWHFVQGISIVCCCISLLWSCLTYSLCNSCVFVRSNHNVLVNWTSSLLQAVWRVCFVTARLAAFLCLSRLLAAHSLLLFLLRLAINLCVVTCHSLQHQQSGAVQLNGTPRTGCRSGIAPSFDAHVQNAVVSFVMCFSEIGAQRSWRCLLLHHCVCITENVITACVFYLVGDLSFSLQTTLPSVILSTTALGLLALAADHWRCHGNAAVATDKMAAACVANTSLLSSAHDFSFQPAALPVTSPPVCSLSTLISSPSLSDTTPMDNATLSATAQPNTSLTASSATRKSAPCQQTSTVSFSLDCQSNDTASRFLSAVELMATAGIEPASFHADSVTEAGRFSPPHASDISELDYVSEGDITLPTVNLAALNQSAPPAVCRNQSELSDHAPNTGDNQSDRSTDSARANHSRAASSSVAAPDYENMCPRNIHHGPLTVRAWKTYSDIGDSVHDMSIALSSTYGRVNISQSSSNQAGSEYSRVAAKTGAKHTYENTDNVQLMLRYLDDEEMETNQEKDCPERLDVSSLVATIDTVTASPQVIKSVPRRSQSSDNLRSDRVTSCARPAQRSLHNTSFDTARVLSCERSVLTARQPNDDWQTWRNTGAISRPTAEPVVSRSYVESSRNTVETKTVHRSNLKPSHVDKENMYPTPSPCYL